MHVAQITSVVRGYAKLMIIHYSFHVFRDGVPDLDAADRSVFLSVNSRSALKVLGRPHLFPIH